MQAVLFDFYGTLVTAESVGPSRLETMLAHGYTVSGEQLHAASSDPLDGQEHAEHSRSREHYVAWERARLMSMARACGVSEDDLERLVDDLHGASKEFTLRAYPEAREVTRLLKRAGVKIAICSNWDWDLDRAVAQVGLEELIDVQITSARAGARKPHPVIYERTLAELGNPRASEVLFVGDSWQPDVEGPMTFGMRVAHVWRASEREGQAAPPVSEGVARIEDLWGVLELVGLG